MRHRSRRRLGGRTPYLVTGLVALLGLGVAGGAVAVAGGADEPGDRVTVAADESARSSAAQRADRSERDPAPPTLAPTPTPTVAPSTSSRPTAARTARSGGSAPASKSTATRRPAGWVNPLPGAETTSCFGPRWGTMHAGIDLAMPENTPIRAAGAGTVVTAGWAYTGYGISVVIDHGNGYLTHYAHQNRTVVSVGARVAAGDVIGYEGATGDVTGPHLHFEVHKGLWNQVDPGPWMREHGVDLGC
ncbi:M23 family metallopeptidase [Plantactinospora soyae]|uniref:M23 family metallopeptidase n=1 Tax=Plantactinospora soyae TaxID=1544732 RepID=UPI00384D1969